MKGPALALPARRLAALVIDHTPRRNADQPRPRVLGKALARPLSSGCKQRLLDSVFGSAEIAKTPSHPAEHLRRQFAQKMLDLRCQAGRQTNSSGGPLITCRTSIGIFNGLPPAPGAADARAAIA